MALCQFLSVEAATLLRKLDSFRFRASASFSLQAPQSRFNNTSQLPALAVAQPGRILSSSSIISRRRSLFYTSSGSWVRLQVVARTAVRILALQKVHALVGTETSLLLLPQTYLVSSRRTHAYEPLLLENEREAVADLLQFLESQC